MTWDLTSPADTDSIRGGASAIRSMKADIQAALKAEGIFPGGIISAPVFRYAPRIGNTASRPAADSANPGSLYVNKTVGTIQRDNGTSWDDITTPLLPPMPTGVILPYGVNVTAGLEPTGWLYCNGQAVNRLSYVDLFALIGTTWGEGDNLNTFNVPDLRGVTLRGRNDGASDGYDDPDSGTRAARLLGGATGDAAGSFQADDLLKHRHTSNTVGGGSAATNGNGAGAVATNTGYYPTSGGNETRMRNAGVSYIIKT